MSLKDIITTALTNALHPVGNFRLKDNIATALTGSCGVMRLKGQHCYSTERVMWGHEVKGHYYNSTERVMWGHEVKGHYYYSTGRVHVGP
jgi:hypothetical protein